MIEFFRSGGFVMWPITLCALLVISLAARCAVSLMRAGVEPPSERLARMDAVLFWGVAAAVLGLIGTLAGVAQMAAAIERFGAVQASTLWSGIKVTLTTSIFGFGILLIALLLWMALRTLPRTSAPATHPAPG